MFMPLNYSEIGFEVLMVFQWLLFFVESWIYDLLMDRKKYAVFAIELNQGLAGISVDSLNLGIGLG